MAWRTHSSLMTGSMPGMAASTKETWSLGSPPKAVDAPGEELGLARHLGVHLHADHDLPIGERALDQLLRVDRNVHR